MELNPRPSILSFDKALHLLVPFETPFSSPLMLTRILKGVLRWWTLRKQTRRVGLPSQTFPPTEAFVQDALLLQLPADIIMEIADRLLPEGAICLLLTCRSFYGLLFHLYGKSSSALPGSPGSRRALSVLLERDTADKFYLCYYCDSLHRIRIESRDEESKPSWWHVHPCPTYGYQHSVPENLPELYFHGFPSNLVRLTINRHVYGGEAGLPLSVLEWRTDRSQPYLNAQRGVEFRKTRIVLVRPCRSRVNSLVG